MRNRRHISLFLAAALVLGTVISPLVHYTWMATSDWFAHTDTAHAPGTHSPSHVPGSERATTTAPTHISCDYDSIFATAQATAPPATDVSVPLADDGVLGTACDLVPAPVRFSCDQPRGPPAA
ncbi:MAG: hypothetical protein COV99_04515 [Bacteroidetes bacterium CG12_big_fil_rev_8_21_14_0_65_60_17]|nr:MAG: hypothetical protein COV99_04515 [Bacteroidetes bacterium CG12_big_fil_rev_8_21_14_0_65_60_17]